MCKSPTADLNKEISVKFITIYSGLSFYPSKQQKIEYAKCLAWVPKLKPMGSSWSLCFSAIVPRIIVL